MAKNRARGGMILNTWWGIVSLVIVAVIIVLAGVVITGTLIRGHERATAAKDAATTGPGSVCGLTGYEYAADAGFTMPTTTWTPTGPQHTTDGVPIRAEQMLLPSVPGSGPGTTSRDGVRSCFARTQTGAVLAAANMLSASATPAIAGKVIAATTADGPGKQAAIDQAAAAPSGPLVRTFQVAGYQVIDYSGTRAKVTVAMAADGTLLGVPVSMVWEHGDWKADLTDDGQMPSQPSELQTLTGFQQWGGGA